jgi:hypothetical protein
MGWRHDLSLGHSSWMYSIIIPGDHMLKAVHITRCDGACL